VFEYVSDRPANERTDLDWSELGSGGRSAVAALLEDSADLADPDGVFEAAARRLIFRRHRERLSQIDRELELADVEQQRRLLVEKQEIAAELRDAGEAATFMPDRAARATGGC